MANIKSQIKRNKQNEKARQRNKAVKSSLKTSVRKFREAADAGDADKATQAMRAAYVKLDKAASKGVIHKNQAANRKSAIAKRVAAAQAGLTGCRSLRVPPARLRRRLSSLAARCGPRRQATITVMRALQRVPGARALALDLGVRHRDRGVRPGQAVRRPAAELLADLVDLPRRHPELGRQRVRALAAGGGADLAEGPDAPAPARW